MINFLIGLLLILLMIFEKYFFVMFENSYQYTIQESARLGIIVIFAVVALLNGASTFRGKLKVSVIRLDFLGRIFLLLSILTILFSFYLNIIRSIPGWDAIALYDARSMFMSSGVKFSDMVNLSNYDPQNSYYYLLYPPYTSLIHYHWQNAINLPVGVFYSCCLLVLAIEVFLVGRRHLNDSLTMILVFITIANPIIFTSSVQEYTNLPFSLYMLTGIYLIGDYITTKNLWKLIFGAILISTSQWIRFLEPLWIGVFLAFLISNLKYKIKMDLNKYLLATFLFVVGLNERLMWSNFVNNIAKSPEIVNFKFQNYIEPIIGVITGALYHVAIFFVASWGVMFLIHCASAVLSIIKFNRDKEFQFYSLVILFTIMIYFSGLYFVSFQSDWWDKLGDSLVRSSSFLIPISGLILLKLLTKYKNGSIIAIKNDKKQIA